MASAVFVNWDEPDWTPHRGGSTRGGVLMTKVAISKPNHNFNNGQFHGETNGFPMDESPAVTQSVSDDASSINHRLKMSKAVDYNVYETFEISSYTRKEVVDLENRLMSELEQIRQLKNRINSGEFTRRPTHPMKSSQTSGNKRPLPSSNFGKNLKPSASENGSMMKACSQILTKLMRHKHGWIFNKPVDVVKMGLHDYYDIIKRPMDLGSVKSKMGKNLYTLPMDFADDMRLTFTNAMAYNPKGHDVYIMAELLLERFEELFQPLSRKLEQDRPQDQDYDEEKQASSWNHFETGSVDKEPIQSSRKSDQSNEQASILDLPSSPLIQSPVKTPSPVRVPPVKSLKQPKPKAKDPNKRDMSLEEKHKLGIGLQSLPQEKMEQVVQIIKKRNGHLKQDGDEIELDIEAVDTETLWELDRLVTNWKKMVSKIKRQALMSSNTDASFNKTNRALPETETIEVASVAKKARKGEAGEEDVDIGDEMPMTSFPPVEIEKDAGGGHGSGSSSSSSSSSSDDSSSSSDSDSEGSSSGSDSDDNNAMISKP